MLSSVQFIYHINHNTFNDIWYNNTFKNIQSDKQNKRQNKIIRKTNQYGHNNPSSVFTKDDVIKIRTRRDCGESMNEVYEDYKHLCTKPTFSKMWRDKTYQNILLNKEE